MEISSATGANLYGFPGLEPYNSDSSFQGVLTAVLSHLQDPLSQGQAGVRLHPPLGP